MAVVFGAVACIRDDDEIRLQLHDRLQRGVAAEGNAEVAGRVEKSGLGQQRTQQAVAAGHPAAPRQRQYLVAMLRHGLSRARDRVVEPRDLGARTVGMTDEIAHLANLRLDLIEIARHGEFGEMKPLFFQQLPRRPFVEQARDDDIGPDHQDVLGARPTASDSVARHRQQRIAKRRASIG